MKKLAIVLPALLLFSTLLFADNQDKKDEVQQADVKFEVLKADNGKPVRNAAVVLHPVGKDGNQSRKGSELKTDAEGKSRLAVPYGKVRVQVIAPGFQTFGEDYILDQPDKVIVIKLNRPKDQYSIYK